MSPSGCVGPGQDKAKQCRERQEKQEMGSRPASVLSLGSCVRANIWKGPQNKNSVLSQRQMLGPNAAVAQASAWAGPTAGLRVLSVSLVLS